MHAVNYFNKLFVFLLVFFFVLSPRFDFNVAIHAGYFSVALLASTCAIRKRALFSLPKPLVAITAFFLVLAIYHLVFATLYDNNGSYFFSICISIIVSNVFGWMLASYLVKSGTNNNDLIDQLLIICAMVAVINASVVLVEYALPEIKSVIESYLLQVVDSNTNYADHSFNLRGLAGGGGAALSVFNAIAILFLIYLVGNKKIAASFALLSAVVITCSNILTGRTGLILSLLFTLLLLVVILIKDLKSGFIGGMRIITNVIFVLILLSLLDKYELDQEAAEWAFEWADGLVLGKFESASSEDLKTMLFLPDNFMDLIFGVGFFEGFGKIYPRSDSGYIKTILSIGILLSILLYSAIIFIYFQINKVSSKYFWLVVAISSVMLFIEIKEPFLYQNYAARSMFLLSGAAMFVLRKRRTSAGRNLNPAKYAE
ncbi:MAG: hypothetical protein H7240_00150 [Glaciimonas sp.]|nr:hypothetical protein [Glaciimonas sp.]